MPWLNATVPSSVLCGPAVPARPGPAGRSDIAVVAPRQTIMPDGHGPAIPQVTAVDDQFGTHTQVNTPCDEFGTAHAPRPAGRSSPSPTSPTDHKSGRTGPTHHPTTRSTRRHPSRVSPRRLNSTDEIFGTYRSKNLYLLNPHPAMTGWLASGLLRAERTLYLRSGLALL